MRLPNKNTSFSESVIAKFPMVLNILEQNDMTVKALYENMKDSVCDVSEFIEVLDCLYALGKLEINPEMRSLRYVD